MTQKLEFLSAVLLISKDADRLATFYRDVLGVPLEAEQHGPTAKHYGCELGDIHFAIHPVENFKDNPQCEVGSTRLAFTTFDIHAFAKKVEAKGVKLAYPPRDKGFAIMTALTDPDGNYVEFTQLSDRWYKHLEQRKSQGHDMVSRWKAAQEKTKA